jgi:hypothetical protein
MEKRAPETVDEQSAARRPSTLWPGVILLGITPGFFIWLGWRRWPDPLVDFGQQIYMPWRLTQGAVLYQDLAYVYGSLSVYYHALLFQLFGVSLNVILISNFLILGFLLVGIGWLFLKAADMLTAGVAVLALITLATGEFLDVGNYNYLTPYSHEVLHGLALAVLMLAALTRWLKTGRILALLLAAFCLGLVTLTKPEIFLGAAVPCSLGLFMGCRQKTAREIVRSVGLALLAGAVPLAGWFLLFQAKVGTAAAQKILLGAWLPLLHATHFKLPFYLWCTGLDQPGHHLGQILLETAGLACVVGVAAWRLTRPTLDNLERLVLWLVIGGISFNYPWQHFGHALPAILLASGRLWWRDWKSASGEERSRLFFPALWLAFSVALLAKLGLNLRIYHYGVFLAMPAFLTTVYLLVRQLPQFLARRQMPSDPFRQAMLILLVAGLAHLALLSDLFYRDKTSPLGSGGDQIYTYNQSADPTGPAMQQAAAWIETHTAPTNTLAVMPEGVMLNYLTRRPNSTPYVVFASEVFLYGEARMLAAYQQHPPDYIALIHRSGTEYGHPYFGQEQGFGYDVMQWVKQNYDPVWLIGQEPLQTNAFGIKILKSKRLPH